MSDGSSDVCSSYLLIVPEYQSVDEALRLFVDLLGPTIDDVANVRIRLGSTGGDQQGLLARRARNRTLLPHSSIMAVGEDRALGLLRGARSEARRVGKECVSTCRSRWSPYQ